MAINTFLGANTSGILVERFWYVVDDTGTGVLIYHPFAQQMTTMALVYMSMVLAYAGFVMGMLASTMNIVILHMVEDMWLLGTVTFACYTVVLDHTFYKEGQFSPTSLVQQRTASYIS